MDKVIYIVDDAGSSYIGRKENRPIAVYED